MLLLYNRFLSGFRQRFRGMLIFVIDIKKLTIKILQGFYINHNSSVKIRKN